MSRPLVTAVIPVHDGEMFLAEALDSVFSQTEPPHRVLVVDDGSSDASREVAARFPGATLLTQECRGVAAARNAGLERVQTDLVAFLDQDDVWMPNKLEAQVDALLADSSAGFAICQEIFFVEGGEAAPSWVRPRALQGPVTAYEPSALVAWRTTFDRVGIFDSSYSLTPDADWYLRAVDLGVREVIVKEPLLRRRLHSKNGSREAARMASELRRVTLASIRRKRLASAPGSS